MSKEIILSLTIGLLVIGKTYAIAAPTVDGDGDTCVRPTSSIGDGWKTAHPRDVGLDCTVLTEALDAIEEHRYGLVHSLLVIRAGKLVFEKYWDGHLPNWEGYAPVSFTAKTPHDVASVTKSVMATAFGIALDRGLIDDINDSVSKYLPRRPIYQRASVRNIRLLDLLTMTAGFAYDENSIPYDDPRNDAIGYYDAYSKKDGDPLRTIFGKPVIYTPGTVLNYGGNQSNALALILERRSGMSLEAYASEYLMKPLGIKSAKWLTESAGTVGSGDLKISPRDLAKIAYLYVNKGRWKNTQIISEDWVTEALRDHVPIGKTARQDWEGGRGYGYQIWTREPSSESSPTESYGLMLGYGGQFAAMIPELDMIVIGTAGNWANENAFTPDPIVLNKKKYYFDIVDEFFLDAVKK